MAAPAPGSRETILVVDDEPEVLSVAADILRGAGYTVHAMWEPREALRFARNRPDPIHLLLVDVVMPLMNGRQLAAEMRAIRPDIKVLFMSAYAIESVEDYAIRLSPGEPFLPKPFTPAEIESKVRAALAYQPPPPRRR